MPTEDKVTRKLRAILSADVKGYSLLMADDEAFTIKTLKEYRSIMSTLIQEHNGRVVDAPGDNLLADFSSIVDAVECAVEIQKRLEAKNDQLEDDKKLQYRIGVNIGDVVQDGDRIYGNGVNVSARIESLADPGGVCISRNAYDHISDKLNFGYEYLGEQSVKNIKKPVRVYKLLMADEDAGKLIGDLPKPTARNWIWATVILAAVIIVSVSLQIYRDYTKPEFEPAKVEEMAYPLPEKPSIAVLPFVNMSGDPGKEYFSDGITEQIITSLSKVPRVFVISRTSTFAYKSKPVKVQQVAEDLGIRYVLEGSVQQSGDKIRITAQLIDALTGRHIWAERFERDYKDLFALQDEITLKILSEMQVKLTDGERARSVYKESPKLGAYEKYLEAITELRAFNPKSHAIAQRLAQEVIDLDPGFSGGYRLMSGVHFMAVHLGITKSPNNSLDQAIELLQKCIVRDENDDRAYSYLCHVYAMKRQFEKSVEAGKKAIEINPNSDEALVWLAMTLRWIGKPEEAIELHHQAIRLAPYPPSYYYHNLGQAYRTAGRCEEAIEEFNKALHLTPRNIFAFEGLTVCYGILGQDNDSRAAAAEILKLNPNYTIKFFRERDFHRDRQLVERWADVLRKAGIPEYPPGKEPTEKPSIAVLPFDNLSDDPEQEYFIDGIVEDIITALSKTDQLLVIARNSSFSYKGKPVKIKQVAEELGVRYVLEGSVRKTEDRVRITAQLIDATTEHHLWAERYDRDLKDIFALQDEMTMKIVAALDVMLTSGEEGRMYERQYKTLKGLMKFSEASAAWNEGTKEGLIRHGQLAQELIELEPDSPGGYSFLGWNHMERARIESPMENIEKAFELAQKAISLDESNDFSYALLGAVYLQMRQYEKAIAAGEKSVALLPNSAFNHIVFGGTLTYADKPEDALYHIKQGLRLDPYPESWKFFVLARYYWVNKQYEEALTALNKAVHLAPGYVGSQVLLAMTYVRLDRQEEAEAAAKKVLEIYPDYSLERLSKTLPYKNQDVLQGVIDAGLKAGLPM